MTSPVYAASDSKKPGQLWIVVLNKDLKNPVHGFFQIQGAGAYGRYQAYGFNAASPDLKALRQGTLDQNRFDLDLPPLSATLLALEN